MGSRRLSSKSLPYERKRKLWNLRISQGTTDEGWRVMINMFYIWTIQWFHFIDIWFQVYELSEKEMMEERKAMADYMQQYSRNYRGVAVEPSHKPKQCANSCGLPNIPGKDHPGMVTQTGYGRVEIIHNFKEYLSVIRKSSVWMHFEDLGALANTRNVHLIIVLKRWSN